MSKIKCIDLSDKIKCVVLPDRTKIWLYNGIAHREEGPAIEYPNGCGTWFRHGVIHRDGGPAMEYLGLKIWFQNGVKHRDDGPAEETLSGGSWYQHGKLHRLDGPASVDHFNRPAYYFEDFNVSQEQLEKIAARIRRRETKIKNFILDRMLPIIYNPCRKSGQRRMLESYLNLNRELNLEMSLN